VISVPRFAVKDNEKFAAESHCIRFCDWDVTVF